MKRIAALLLLLIAPAVCLAADKAQEAAPQLPEDKAAPLAKLELAEGDSIVFLGDSITHQCLYTQYVEDYFLTRMPNVRLKFHNSGVGGDRAADGLARFERDVAHFKPKYVTVLLGMNDGTYQPYNEEIFRTYEKGMLELVEKIKGIGATPVLMHPTMFDARAARANFNGRRSPEGIEFYNSTLGYYGAWLQDIAYRQGLGYVNMYSRLNQLTLDTRKTQPDFTLIPDAVHPDANGQIVMAFALLEDLGVPRTVSSITISRGAGEKAVARGTGAKVTNAQFTTDGLEFDLAAQSLPWVVPEVAQEGAKLLRLGHRLSREALEIHGLPTGQYDLLIDGQKVGTYSSAQLERHIELQENTLTPQYQQALAVAEMNQARNDTAVHPLRDAWRTEKQLRQAKAALAADPENKQLQANVEKIAKQMDGFEERIAALEEKAQTQLDQIYQANQPKLRHYSLVRVEAPAQQKPQRPAKKPAAAGAQ